MLTIKTHQLKAATHTAAVKDIRFYLKGVLIERCTNGDVHIVSTDGACLFAGLIADPVVDCSQVGPWRMIIPIDAVKTACKTKNPVITLVPMPDGRYTLGDVVFTPVDGTFPDWRMVAHYPSIEAQPVAPSMLDPELMCKAFDAVRTWHGLRSDALPAYVQRGESCTVVHGPDCTGFVIVMPYRTKIDTATPFTPAAY